MHRRILRAKTRLSLVISLIASIYLTGASTLNFAGDQLGIITQFYHEGVQAYRQGNLHNATDYFRKVVSLDPKNANAHYYLAISLDRMDRAEEALLQYQQVLSLGADARILNYAKNRASALGSLVPLDLSGRSVSSVLQGGGISRVAVPLKSNRNALMVDAVLSDHDSRARAKGTFIIDTGATYTSISEEMAETLGLDLENAEKIRITTANGRIEVPKVVIERLNVNGLEAHNIEATVIPIRRDSSFTGLLGLSFIRQFVLTIDPGSGQLIFEQN